MFSEFFETVHFECQMGKVGLNLDRAAGGEMTELEQLFTSWRLEEYQFRATGRFVPSHLFETEHQLAPRIGAAYFVKPTQTVLRASYNRMFVTPEYENILLSSSDQAASLVPPEDRLWSAETRRPALVAGLDLPNEVLTERIERRTREMFERGVVEEARAALAAGPLSRTAAKALGLQEVVELPTDEARVAIVRRTLRYAAYQRKWMRRIPGIVMIDANRPPAEVGDAILEVARAR